MLSFLKSHPFAVEAFFESSLVLTFAIPKEEIAHHIPECLELNTLNDKWAFIAVAMVQTSRLRPKGFPRFLGRDFFLIGYRVFVKYTNNARKTHRGLYILKSETDKKIMQFLGNIFTHYNYSTTDIQNIESDNRTEITSSQSNFKIGVEMPEGDITLPQDSPFANWKEARKYSGPLPFTFSYDADTNQVLIIEGVRQNWKPSPVKVNHFQISFLDSLNLKEIKLANAFIIKDIPYHWKKGRIEQWNG